MFSPSKHIASLFLAGGAVCLGGCHSATNPPPVASGSVSVNGTLYAKNPTDGDQVSVQDGRRLFTWYNCYACHGPHGGGAIGPSLRDRAWRYGDSDEQLFTSIAQGRPNGMPTWGNKIPEIQIWELVAYIKSLNTPREPDPPKEPAYEIDSDPKKFASATPGMLIRTAGRQ